MGSWTKTICEKGYYRIEIYILFKQRAPGNLCEDSKEISRFLGESNSDFYIHSSVGLGEFLL